MIILAPEDDSLWKERGLLHYYTENWQDAARDLRRYFFMQGLLLFALGAIDEDGPIALDEADLEFGILEADGFEPGVPSQEGVHSDDDDEMDDEFGNLEYDGVEYESVLDELTSEDQQLLQILSEVEEMRTLSNQSAG